MRTAAIGRVADPAGLEEVRGRIQRWRETRPYRCAMPEALWLAAARLARLHGVYVIARAMRLDYYALKKRVATTPAESSSASPQLSPKFVEVEVSAPTELPIGVVEMERSDGTRLRIRGLPQEAIVALTRAFLKVTP